MEISEKDIFYMKEAISLADKAREADEVPVGALIVSRGKVIARAYNYRENGKNALYHAELMAIDIACKALGGWRLPESTLYVTLEPCVMCAGAIANARIDRVVFGAYDLRFGAYGSLCNVAEIGLNHSPEVVGGVLLPECKEMLQSYFKSKRK